MDFHKDRDAILKVIQTERECVSRNDGETCDRDCGKCDLVLPSEIILDAYDAIIRAI